MPFSSTWRARFGALSFTALSFVFVARLAALPVITQQPRPATGSAGTAVSLSVAATGNGTLTYQWRRDGAAVANATSALFALIRPSQVDNGTYDVLVKDSSGTTTSAVAAVRIGPVVYPESVTPHVPSIVTLETQIAGSLTRLVPLADGRYYVAGGFSSLAGQRRAGLARFKADATVDDSFNPVALDGTIADVAVQTDGRIVIAGDFRTLTTPASAGIARLNPDGSLDPSFATGTGFGGDLRVGSLNIGIGPDGSIFVRGYFSSYQGQPTSILVKLDASGGQDRSYTPPRFQSLPISITPTADGKLYCIGVPYEQAGVMRTNSVCRLLANGSIDPTFDAGAAAATGVPSFIFRQQDGRLLLTGGFSNFGGATNGGIVRLNENGSLDRSFNFRFTSSNDYVTGVAQAANGDLLITGSFSGTPVSGSLARLKPDGSVDRSFTTTGLGTVRTVGVLTSDRIVTLCAPLNSSLGRAHPDVAVLASSGARLSADTAPRFPAAVKMMKLLPDGKFLIAGNFTHWNGSAVTPIVRVNADLTLDASFKPVVNLNNPFLSGAVQADGKIVILSQSAFLFTEVLRLNADGSRDTTFRGTSISSPYVEEPTFLPDGRIVIPDDGTRPIELHVLAADGTWLTTHEFAAGGAGYPASNHVARTADGQFLVAGGFGSWAGQAKSKLVRLNADGSVDSALTLPNTITKPMLYAMGFDSMNNPAQSSGRIILKTWGTATSVYNIALLGLQSNGQPDPTFVSALPELWQLGGHTILADDRLLVWATYRPTPQEFADPLVMRLLATGAKDPSFAVVGETSVVNRLTLTWSHALTLDSGDMVAATRGGRLMRLSRVIAPLVTTQPVALTRQPGERATFSVAAAGAGTFSYQWYFNGAPITGATSATFTVPFVQSASAGRYQAIVTNANGSATSTEAVLAIDATTGAAVRLTNLSVRANIGASPLIAGFAVAGGERQLLVRGIGPGLVPFGVAGVIADPRIILYSGSTIIDQNDNWGGSASLTATATALGAFSLSGNSLDAMLLRAVSGPHTVQLSAASGSGLGLVEVYDATGSATAGGRLINLSARYQVGTGGDVLIAGFTIGGSGSKALLVRGVGPGLAAFGVGGTLVDPQIAIYSGTARIAENNDWDGSSALTTAFTAVGAFSLAPSSKDAALLISLPAGSYTVQLSGTGGTVGEGLIEIYEVP